MLNKKNIVLIIFFFIFNLINVVQAQIVNFHLPFSQTGNYQAVAKLVNGGLEEKGWKFDFKVTNNLILSKHAYENSTEPFILAWSELSASAKNEPFYLPAADEKNFIGFTHSVPYYICTTKDIVVDDFYKKKLKIGIANTPAEEKFIKGLINHTKTKHNAVGYKSSTELSAGLFSGEIDLAVSSLGSKWVTNNQAKCIFNTGKENLYGSVPMFSVFPNFSMNEFRTNLYYIGKNFTSEQLTKLRNDLNFVKANHKPYLDHIKNMHYDSYTDSLENQLLYLKKIDNYWNNE